MKYYSYFPGCSAESTGLGLGISTEAIASRLDMDLIELEDWNCCGSTPYGSLAEEESLVVAGRNLALAEPQGFDLVTPCSSCYVTLKKANRYLKEHPAMLARVNEALAVAGLEYRGSITVRHIVDVLYNDITPEGIASRTTINLGGLKVAPYYGCQLVRPRYGLDNADNPVSLDRLVTCLGAEAVDYPLKTRCCGGSLTISEESRVLGLIHKLMRNAAENGAQCLVTACPLCQTNLDAFQSRARARFGGDYELPVLYITQLVGVALGLQPRELGFSSHIVSPDGVLDFIYNRVNYATTHPVEAEERG